MSLRTAAKNDAKTLGHNWGKEVQLSDKYAGAQIHILLMLKKFQYMWDRHLDQDYITYRRVYLITERKQSVHSTSKQAGPYACGFEKAQTNKMLLQKLIKPAQSNWATLLKFLKENYQSVLSTKATESKTSFPRKSHIQYLNGGREWIGLYFFV